MHAWFKYSFGLILFMFYVFYEKKIIFWICCYIEFVAYIIQVLLHYLLFFSPFCTYYLLSPSLCNIVASFCSKPSIQNDSAICIKFGAWAATADCCSRFVTPAIIQRSTLQYWRAFRSESSSSHLAVCAWQCHHEIRFTVELRMLVNVSHHVPPSILERFHSRSADRGWRLPSKNVTLFKTIKSWPKNPCQNQSMITKQKNNFNRSELLPRG